MKYLLAVLFLLGFTTRASFSSAVKDGLSGSNPNLTSEEVLHLVCAKSSDKVFNPVYYNDPNMTAKLNVSKPCGFVMHGYKQNGNIAWMREMAETWVKNHDTNVCRVDWGIYAQDEYIVAATRNVNLVAYHLAKFIKSLHDGYSLNYADVTLIGHSLGGQICGRTGYHLGGGIGRIIAMDPAGPLFTFPVSVPLEDQLDKSDAKFVTVVHSNNYILGVGYSIGHADYYANGGAPIQPGCVFDFEPITCSHFRAVKFVQLGMNNDPLCRAIKCDTYPKYVIRKCSSTTDTWGINSAKIEGDFYFWTGSNPRCMNKYWPSLW